MLLYHPSFDCYHSMFRMLQIIECNPDHVFEIEEIRILDFYLLFPSQLREFKFPKIFLSLKKDLLSLHNNYSSLENQNRVFHQLEPFQTAALFGLASYGIVDREILSKGNEVKRTLNSLPHDLSSAIRNRSAQSQNLINFLSKELVKIPLRGPGGLKDRTSLLEHKYDLIAS